MKLLYPVPFRSRATFFNHFAIDSIWQMNCHGLPRIMHAESGNSASTWSYTAGKNCWKNVSLLFFVAVRATRGARGTTRALNAGISNVKSFQTAS
jgi:hypothetical protein